MIGKIFFPSHQAQRPNLKANILSGGIFATFILQSFRPYLEKFIGNHFTRLSPRRMVDFLPLALLGGSFFASRVLGKIEPPPPFEYKKVSDHLGRADVAWPGMPAATARQKVPSATYRREEHALPSENKINAEEFIYPVGDNQLTLTFSGDVKKDKELCEWIKSNADGIDIMILEYYRAELLENLQPVLASIKTLALKHSQIKWQDIVEIKKAHPQICAFDLRGSKITDKREDLQCIIIEPGGESNAQNELKRLYQALFSTLSLDSSNYHRGDVKNLVPFFSEYPAVAFVSNCSYLRGRKDLIHKSTLFQLIKDNFFSITMLDLTGTNIEFRDLQKVIQKFPNLSHLSLENCKDAFMHISPPPSVPLHVTDVVASFTKFLISSEKDSVQLNLAGTTIYKKVKGTVIEDQEETLALINALENLVKEVHEEKKRIVKITALNKGGNRYLFDPTKLAE